MSRRSRRVPSPLPQREGIDAVRLRLPVERRWSTVLDHLVERLPVPAREVEAMVRGGEVVTADGRPVGLGTAYLPGGSVWFHRERAPEPEVPFEIEVVHHDEHLVVADKPHFLATTPRGSHITETALARLRRRLALPDLSPAHRLDRLTAGLVLFTVVPGERGAYQRLFAERRVHKEYEAIAPCDPALALPHTVRSRIVKDRGVIAARELPGEPNAVTEIELLERRSVTGPLSGGEAAPGALGRYRLLPRTGRTHQLRVHMNALGLPLLGDPVYPEVRDPAPDDYRRPLQLLSRVIEFIDPVTGEARVFESGRTLLAWTDHERWASGEEATG